MAVTPTSNAPRAPQGLAGQLAGEYRVGRLIGEGGFGAVFEAEHPVLKRRAAVKVLHRLTASNSEAALRFVSEAQAVNQIRHRHIVDIFSFGNLADGRHFYVMDLLEGESLDRYLERVKRFDVGTALQILQPIAAALDVAHAAGIVHRDLKPQNIFLAWEANGEVVPKLLDFGVAKLLDDSAVKTVSGTPIGTPLYMSPEQARGDRVDRRADVYALGVLMHELITGVPPITADSMLAVLMAHIVQPPRLASACNPALSPQLDAPILHMLAKEPDARPGSAGEALAAVAAAAVEAGLSLSTGLPNLERPPYAPQVDDVAHASTLDGGAPPDALGTLESNERVGAKNTSAVHARARTKLPWAIVALLLLLLGVFAYRRASPTAERPPAPRPAAPASAPSTAGATSTSAPAVAAPPLAKPEPASVAPAAPVAVDAGPPTVKSTRKRKAPARDRFSSDLESPF
ncbi:MAG: serine/threonine-protein kinase [Polyangiales bacterium]